MAPKKDLEVSYDQKYGVRHGVTKEEYEQYKRDEAPTLFSFMVYSCTDKVIQVTWVLNTFKKIFLKNL